MGPLRCASGAESRSPSSLLAGSGRVGLAALDILGADAPTRLFTVRPVCIYNALVLGPVRVPNARRWHCLPSCLGACLGVPAIHASHFAALGNAQ